MQKFKIRVLHHWSNPRGRNGIHTRRVVKPIIFKSENVGLQNTHANLNLAGKVIRHVSCKWGAQGRGVFNGPRYQSKKINLFALGEGHRACCSK